LRRIAAGQITGIMHRDVNYSSPSLSRDHKSIIHKRPRMTDGRMDAVSIAERTAPPAVTVSDMKSRRGGNGYTRRVYWDDNE